MAIDMLSLLERLSAERPVFHSEADFQHALAWRIQLENPAAKVPLETQPARQARLDLLVELDDERTAVELKYLVARFSGWVDGERFDLPNEGAHDVSRHDVVRDIARVERFVAEGWAESGWVVVLSNDSTYWRPGTKADPVDAMFRIHEGRALSGTLAWGRRAGAGTTRRRDEPVALRRAYACGWRDYSTVKADDGRDVRLRHRALEITGDPNL